MEEITKKFTEINEICRKNNYSGCFSILDQDSAKSIVGYVGKLAPTLLCVTDILVGLEEEGAITIDEALDAIKTNIGLVRLGKRGPDPRNKDNNKGRKWGNIIENGF